MKGVHGLSALIVVLILLVVVAVIATVVGLRSRGAASTPPPAEPTDPFQTGDQDSLRGDPRKLRAGDIVEIRTDTYTVRGSLRYSEGGWTWAEHLLDDAKGTQVWLGVEEDPDLELSLWTPVADVDEPGPRKLEYRGRTYYKEESGSAHFSSEATTGLDSAGSARYYDYEAPDGAMLGFESFGDADWEASAGEELTRYDVRIYPAAS